MILLGYLKLERVKGIEPSSQAWEARILPLNHTRCRFDAAGTLRQGSSARHSEVVSDPLSPGNWFAFVYVRLRRRFESVDRLP